MVQFFYKTRGASGGRDERVVRAQFTNDLTAYGWHRSLCLTANARPSTVKPSGSKDWLLGKRKELADGMLVDDNNISTGEFLDKWLDIVSPQLRPSTLATHETIIRLHIKPALENLKLSQITPARLQTLYTQKLKEGLSRRTVKYIHTIMHRCWIWLSDGVWWLEMSQRL